MYVCKFPASCLPTLVFHSLLSFSHRSVNLKPTKCLSTLRVTRPDSAVVAGEPPRSPTNRLKVIAMEKSIYPNPPRAGESNRSPTSSRALQSRRAPSTRKKIAASKAMTRTTPLGTAKTGCEVAFAIRKHARLRQGNEQDKDCGTQNRTYAGCYISGQKGCYDP